MASKPTMYDRKLEFFHDSLTTANYAIEDMKISKWATIIVASALTLFWIFSSLFMWLFQEAIY